MAIHQIVIKSKTLNLLLRYHIYNRLFPKKKNKCYETIFLKISLALKYLFKT